MRAFFVILVFAVFNLSGTLLCMDKDRVSESYTGSDSLNITSEFDR